MRLKNALTARVNFDPASEREREVKRSANRLPITYLNSGKDSPLQV